MVIDGTQIATDLLAQVASGVAGLKRVPTLVAITCAPNFETQKYLAMKKRRAAAVGIVLQMHILPRDSTTDQVVACVHDAVQRADGVVVQLPLPPHIDRDMVIQAVPAPKDPDGFHYDGSTTACLPPVVGAIDEIARRFHVEWKHAQVTVLGHGKLVGQPAAVYARSRGAQVTILHKDNFVVDVVREADIVISGIGQPHFITPNMVKPGVVVFDAGTSEEGGILVGDVSPLVANVSTLLTPVPGGIGPITIAYLLRNLLDLCTRQ